MTFSHDHLISFTLSAALHLLGMLLLGRAALQRADAPADIAPELQLTSVRLTLSETEPLAPGAASAPAQPEVPQLAIPEPERQPPQELPEKPDFTEALPDLPLPPPEPLPEPKVEPAPVPAPEPPPVPSPPPPAPVAQAPRPAPQPAAATPPQTIPPPLLPCVESDRAAGDGGAAGRLDAQPSLDRAIRPVYPLGARRRGEEGTVVLDVRVAADGRADGVTLVRSSGFPELDRAAERAAAQARFNPATRGGHPVESAARLTLVFRLRDL
jgi:protein TonB